jgi:hypothetical protein
MKILPVDREIFYDLVRATFNAMKIQPVAMELGVYDGQNAKKIYETLSPARIFLIDGWDAQLPVKAYTPFQPAPEWIKPLSAYSRYYGGDVLLQSTWDNLYSKTVSEFSNVRNCTIIKAESHQAHAQLQKALNGGKLDFAYIDGNHQYEYVFSDLMLYSKLCAENSVIQMNDCCHSVVGSRQNLGVLEACVKFIKMSDWRPLAINLRNFSDLILVRKNSRIGSVMDGLIESSPISYVEVPYQLLGASQVVTNIQNVVSMKFT